MARSPSVEAFEKDGTLNTTSSGESAAGFAGDFDWGPCELETTVSSIDDLIAFFAKPTDRNYADWFSASNFLNYSSKLYVPSMLSFFPWGLSRLHYQNPPHPKWNLRTLPFLPSSKEET